MRKVIVKSQVQDYIKKRGLNTKTNTLDALEKSFHSLLDGAIARAKSNDRKTLMARDC